MSEIQMYVMLFNNLVGMAEKIRAAVKAKGEEAEREFEEAIALNAESFEDMVRARGGNLPN